MRALEALGQTVKHWTAELVLGIADELDARSAKQYQPRHAGKKFFHGRGFPISMMNEVRH